MRMRPYAIIAMAALSACSDHRTEFTASIFENAKRACNASDAYVMKSDPKAIGFRGFSPDYAAQAECLMRRLKGTDARRIGFISELPH